MKFAFVLVLIVVGTVKVIFAGVDSASATVVDANIRTQIAIAEATK